MRMRQAIDEIHEKQAHIRIHRHISERQEHPVPVVGGESQGVLVQHAYESRSTALVGADWAALGVGGGKEEHVHPFDERAVVLVEAIVD
jgi:hypothetical protein